MPLSPQALLVLTNVPDADVAERLARALLEARLAACVNILPAVRSLYHWQGALEETYEATLQIKTIPAHYAALEAAIKAIHPYAVPESIAIPIVDGLHAYFYWIAQETNKDRNV
ncbi:divalent-cation tolerance protein CutA [Herminiimonas sp. NPDC097707]|uniref:divalent-cation tolerance protein CutA n=1 Tax=Herminiimonas sp. NPDC097707 TaxID=3364007 RepID=UPI00383A1B42